MLSGTKDRTQEIAQAEYIAFLEIARFKSSMQSPSGSTLGPSHPYCRNLFQRLTVLFIMIAYLGEKGNEAVEYHDSFV